MRPDGTVKSGPVAECPTVRGFSAFPFCSSYEKLSLRIEVPPGARGLWGWEAEEEEEEEGSKKN